MHHDPHQRNDPRQYDELAATWWDPHGPLAMLHWIARARARHIPPPGHTGAPPAAEPAEPAWGGGATGPAEPAWGGGAAEPAEPAPEERPLLLDIACGGGAMAPYTNGYRHVGIDLTDSALRVARGHGVAVVRADARRLPFPDACASVVVAGEVLEHVPDLSRVVAEVCRVLAPGGTLILDTIAATALARLVAVTLAERMPGGPPASLHDPALFVDRTRLIRECADHGVCIELSGLRPSLVGYVGWVLRRRESVPMVRTRSTAILFAATGRKARESR